MTLPTAVEKILNDHQVTYQFSETPKFINSNSPISEYVSWVGATRSILLKSGKDRLQVIVPADSMVELKAVESTTGKQWQALSDNEIQHVINSQALFSLPAIPQLTAMPTLVDEAVLDYSEVIIESGADMGLIRLRGQDFKQLLDKSIAAQISVRIDKGNSIDPKQDRQQIVHAVENFTAKRVQKRLEDTLEFPPLPITATRIINLRVNPNASVQELADIVEIDPSLAAQVVGWASSAYYAAPSPIRSVQDAIIRVLGFDLVMNLSLGLSLGKTLKFPNDQPEGFTSYWHKAVYTAATVEELVKIIPAEVRPELGLSCLSGLLHNFGYLVLAEVFPPYFSSICRHIEANPHLHSSHIEKHLIGVNREQMGAWLMNFWSMPDEISTAIRHQHNPHFNGPYSIYANVLYLANALLQQRGIGGKSCEEIPEVIFKRLQIQRESAVDIVNAIVESAESIHQMADDMAQSGS